MRTSAGPVTIDELLDGLEFHWNRIPEVAAQFSRWGDLERLDFIVEWTLQEEDLRLLSDLIAEGSPTVEQCSRYHDLLGVVERNRAIVGRLIGTSANQIRR